MNITVCIEAKKAPRKARTTAAKAFHLIYTHTQSVSYSVSTCWLCACVCCTRTGAIFGAYWPMAKDCALFPASEETTPPALLCFVSLSLRVKAPPSGGVRAINTPQRLSTRGATTLEPRTGAQKTSLLSVWPNPKEKKVVFFPLYTLFKKLSLPLYKGHFLRRVCVCVHIGAIF